MVVRQHSVRRARRAEATPHRGFVITWDVDNRDASVTARLRRFVFGYVSRKNCRNYRYRGFVEREGVRYLGQSVLFVLPQELEGLLTFLQGHGVAHVVTEASVGAVVASAA